QAIEALVSADPLFVPQSADISPRILAMFTEVRRRILPEIARRAYLAGRSAFQAKDFAAATRQFDQSLRVINQAQAERVAEMDDLWMLVSGFVDLTRVATERPSNPLSTPAPATSSPAPGVQAPGESYIAPVAIRQDLPPWTPPTSAMGG